MTQISEDADGNPCFREDCRQDKDNCPDCCDGDLYRSPDEYEVFGMER